MRSRHSRSSLAPELLVYDREADTDDIMPDPAQTGSLDFDSRFESGNLRCAVRVLGRQYTQRDLDAERVRWRRQQLEALQKASRKKAQARARARAAGRSVAADPDAAERAAGGRKRRGQKKNKRRKARQHDQAQAQAQAEAQAEAEAKAEAESGGDGEGEVGAPGGQDAASAANAVSVPSPCPRPQNRHAASPSAAPPPPRDPEILTQAVDQEYDLQCQVDTFTKGHIQWFYFSVGGINARCGMRVRLNITNMLKKSSLYNFGMLPVVYSMVSSAPALQMRREMFRAQRRRKRRAAKSGRGSDES